jgi:hypothetical protein
MESVPSCGQHVPADLQVGSSVFVNLLEGTNSQTRPETVSEQWAVIVFVICGASMVSFSF